jgi:hypothetical protein
MHSNYGRAISVRQLLMVIVVVHGRAICSFMHFKYGRAISVRKTTYWIYPYAWLKKYYVLLRFRVKVSDVDYT